MNRIKHDRIQSKFLNILIFYALISWYVDANNIFPNINLTPFFLLFLLLFVIFISLYQNYKINSFGLIWSPFIILILLNILFRYRLGISTALQIIIAFIFLISISSNISIIKKSLLILKFFTMFYAISVIFHYLFQDIHMWLLGYFLNNESYSIVSSLMNKGFYAGFSSQTGHVAAYLSTGLGLLFLTSNRFNRKRT